MWSYLRQLFLIMLTLILLSCGGARRTVYEGVSVRSRHKALEGNLLFLYQKLREIGPNEYDVSCKLVRYDLRTRALSELATLEHIGALIPASDERRVVVFALTSSTQDVTIVDLADMTSRTLSFDPTERISLALVGERLFLCMDLATRRIIWQDLLNSSKGTLELPGAQKRRYEDYRGFYRSRQHPTRCFFEYNSWEDILKEGREYPDGLYSYDVQTGQYERHFFPVDHLDSLGRHIHLVERFFSYRLCATSPPKTPDPDYTGFFFAEDYKDTTVRVKYFSKWLLRGYLPDDIQISPSGRYALLMRMRRGGGFAGENLMAMAVDLISGETIPVMEFQNSYEKDTHVSNVLWIP